MQKIDKILDTNSLKSYQNWIEKLEKGGKTHPLSRTHYHDIVQHLFQCQKGVCAYTEMRISVQDTEDTKTSLSYSHFGELEHFDPSLKKEKYWLWENLFMIHAAVNGLKKDKSIISYLKPDLPTYSPEKYFDYDENTHRFIPNTDIEDKEQIKEIQYMIDEVLFLNHGIVRKERENFINDLKFKKQHGFDYTLDRFFTSVGWCLFL